MSAAAAAAVASAAHHRSGQKRKNAAYDDGAGNESDANDADYQPSSSASRSVSASASRSRSISPASLADAKSAPPSERAPKRRRQPQRRAAAAAAASAAEAAAETGGDGSIAVSAREAREDREEEDPEMAELRKQREIMRVGQVFLADLPAEKHAWFSWLWDTERDPATTAAKDAATVITKDTLGLKMTTAMDDYRRAWLRHVEETERSSFAGGQSDGGYCWACENKPSIEYRDQPNEHLDWINHLILKGRDQDPHYVAMQILTYYVIHIAENTNKIWPLTGIYEHIVKHLKDDVYMINALVINNMNKLDKLEEKGVLRDKTSVDCYVKLSNLQLKLLTAKRHVQRETSARTRT